MTKSDSILRTAIWLSPILIINLTLVERIFDEMKIPLLNIHILSEKSVQKIKSDTRAITNKQMTSLLNDVVLLNLMIDRLEHSLKK